MFFWQGSASNPIKKNFEQQASEADYISLEKDGQQWGAAKMRWRALALLSVVGAVVSLGVVFGGNTSVAPAEQSNVKLQGAHLSDSKLPAMEFHFDTGCVALCSGNILGSTDDIKEGHLPHSWQGF